MPSEVIVRYPILVKKDYLETVEQAWTNISAELSELGVLKGWLVKDDTMPIYACLEWQDTECWQQFRQYGQNPISKLTGELDKGILYGYYDPIEPTATSRRNQTVFRL